MDDKDGLFLCVAVAAVAAGLILLGRIVRGQGDEIASLRDDVNLLNDVTRMIDAERNNSHG